MPLVELLAERVAGLKAPIAVDGPAGPDLSYDPDFEAVRGEIDKLSSISGEQPDWRRVIELSERLISERSKDFRLAVWWAAAKAQRDGLEGLATALLFLKGLCADYWDTMQPRRPKARGNMTAWLAEQLEGPVRALQLTAADREAMELASQLYSDLDELWSTQLAGDYAGMGGMRGVLRDKVNELPPEAAPAPTAAPAAPDTSGAPAGAAPAAPAAPALPRVTSASDVGRSLRAVSDSIRDAAYELRRADPANAYAYRLQRVAIWLEVQALPPAENGMTRIPPPAPDLRPRFDALASAGSWRELLEAVETASLDYIFWLDLHRFAALALEKLGAPFMDARATVGREVVALLRTFPELAKLSFSDGTRFADAGTESWLDEEQAKLGATAAVGSAALAEASDEDRELAERFENAREMVMSGNVADGLALAVTLAARGADARARFRAHLTVAELAVKAGKTEIARPTLEALLAEIDERGLEEWEPSLCAAAFSMMLSCVSRADEEAEFSRLFARLSRIDPAAAIKAAG
jgi:type VI secretion system protein VasJ